MQCWRETRRSRPDRKLNAARENPARNVFRISGEITCVSSRLATWLRNVSYDSEQRVGLRNQAVAVVDGVGGRKSVAIAEDVVRSQRCRNPRGWFAWDCCRRAQCRWAARSQQFRAVRLRPKLHVVQHRGIQLGTERRRRCIGSSPSRASASGTTLTLLSASTCRNPS